MNPYELFEEVSKRNEATEHLYRRIEARINVGVDHCRKLVERAEKMVIKDRLVDPKSMLFMVHPTTSKVVLDYSVEDTGVVSMHHHAFSQLCAKVGLPITYANSLNVSEEWRKRLLVENLNSLFRNTDFSDKRTAGPMKFLHRIIGYELRGFLSRRFNRHLASAPLLNAFLYACEDVGARPVDAISGDVKLSLKCMLPLIFEPIAGQPVCFGIEWSNSDFGAGRMQVALTVWAPGTGRFSVLDHALSKVHIGSVLEDSDLEISDETAKKEAAAQASAIRDAVISQLSPMSVKRLTRAIQLAHEEEVPWHRLKGQLSRFLNKKEIESIKTLLEENVIDLPPINTTSTGEKLPNKWWAVSAISWLAGKVEDDSRRTELEHAAGSILDVFMRGDDGWI